MKVVVCLPTRNEAAAIKQMIVELGMLQSDTGYDFFVSDGHSTDATVEIAKKHKVEVHIREKPGRGYGIRQAFDVAASKGYDILVIIDCDCTYPVASIPVLVDDIRKGADMALGVRSTTNIPWLHRLPNKFHTLMVNLLFFRLPGKWLHDVNSSMRAFRLGKFRKPFKSENFDIEAEMTIRAIKDGLAIKEVPVSYSKRVGTSKIRIKDGFVILWRIITERFTN